MEANPLKRVLAVQICRVDKRPRLSTEGPGSSGSDDTVKNEDVRPRRSSDPSSDVNVRPRRSLDACSEANESVHSLQQRETDCARDTSDTSIDSEDSMTEYSVAHLTPEERNPFFSTDDSDEVNEINEIAELGAVVAAVSYNSEMGDIDMGQLADTSTELSTSPTSNSDADPELPRMDFLDFWTCAQCNAVNGNRHVPFCSKCYQKRKTFFPPRPRGKRRFPIPKMNSDSGVDAGCSSQASETAGESSQNQDQGEDVVDGPGSKPVCPICYNRPTNGVFNHGSTAHLYCCFKCAMTIWRRSGKCPLCRKKIDKVVKLLSVDG